MAFIFSWWHFFNKFFFFSFFFFFLFINFLFTLLQFSLRWYNFAKLLLVVLIIVFFLFFFFFWISIISHLSWFNDPYWYTKTRFINDIQLSHEPLKWSWGVLPRDHFTYHDVTSIFWTKNDKPLVSILLFFYFFIFLILLFIILMWFVLSYRLNTNKELPYTLLTYAIAFVRQFFFLFCMIYLFILISFFLLFWRYPIEFFYFINFFLL